MIWVNSVLPVYIGTSGYLNSERIAHRSICIQVDTIQIIIKLLICHIVSSIQLFFNRTALTQTGNSLTGQIAWNGLDPAVYNFTGTITGMDITMSWNQDSTTLTLNGTISADGTEMTGTWTSSDGTSGTWQASGERIVPAK